MTSCPPYRLVVKRRAGYADRLAAAGEKLASFHSDKSIEWRSRIESWLQNFSGVADQEIALTLVQKLRVISDAEEIEGCTALLAELRATVKPPTTLFHFAHEPSGRRLIRILQKRLRVKESEVLLSSSFGKRGPLKPGDVVAIWDRWNGSRAQLMKQVAMYQPLLDTFGKKLDAVRFVYLAGRSMKEALPRGIFLHRALEDIPVLTDAEHSLCSRYWEAAKGPRAARHLDAGALITYSDNILKDVPYIFYARNTSTWSRLLERTEPTFLTGR